MQVISIIGSIGGAAIGLGLALWLTVLFVKKSTDIGDSSGTIWDFHANVNIFDSCDDVDGSHDAGKPEKIFRKHLNEAIEAAEERAEKQKAERALRRKCGDI
ncbi:MAG: hypothetical protein ILO68_03110 [Clostridia bacterium]|nr:hypothetical protein [Clostridia bacterium]